MLKVIGASWKQTKISWWILIGIILIGVLTIYFGIIPRSEDDGKYAATVFWCRETKKYDIRFWGQNNDPNEIKKGAARAYYQPDTSKTGWATLEIETDEWYPDYVQAFSAGMLEGSLSWLHIYWHWKNTVENACINKEEFCRYIREFLSNNTNAIRAKASALDTAEPFWHQINLFYIQLDGLEYGWKFEVARNRAGYEIDYFDFLWMNIMPDIKDFEKKLNVSRLPNLGYTPSSMALLKLLPQQERNHFLLAHASSGLYSSMLRMRKKYNFGYHRTGKRFSKMVPGRNIRFSSYPASIHSQDDFYQIKLSQQETVTISGSVLHNDNDYNWHLIDSKKHILMGLRVMASNRLSTHGKSWSSLLAKRNSGTGNKQWLHIHTTTRTQANDSLTLWVTEQMPGRVVANDQTKALINRGHWISYEIPHYQEIQTASKNKETAGLKYHGAIFHRLSVLKVLQLGQHNVTDVDSLLYLMRGPDLTLVGRTDLYDCGLPILPHTTYSRLNISGELLSRNTTLTKDNDSQFEYNGSQFDLYSSKFEFNSSQFEFNSLSDSFNGRTNDNATLKLRKATHIQSKTIDYFDKNNRQRYISIEHDALNRFFLSYNTTVKKIFTLQNIVMIYSSLAILNVSSSHSTKTHLRDKIHSRVSDGNKDLLENRLSIQATTKKPVETAHDQYVDVDGVIDLKITNDNEDFIAAAGPPFTVKNNLQLSIAPFQWSKSRFKYLPHNGHSDVWNYLPVASNWKWD